MCMSVVSGTKITFLLRLLSSSHPHSKGITRGVLIETENLPFIALLSGYIFPLIPFFPLYMTPCTIYEK